MCIEEQLKILQFMNEETNNFKSDSIILWGNRLSVGITLITVGVIAFYFRYLPIYIPLFNQLPWGEERLGEKAGIFFPVGIVLIILLVNYFLERFLYTKIPLISRIIAITALLASIIACIFTVRTIQLII